MFERRNNRLPSAGSAETSPTSSSTCTCTSRCAAEILSLMFTCRGGIRTSEHAGRIKGPAGAVSCGLGGVGVDEGGREFGDGVGEGVFGGVRDFVSVGEA